MKFCVNTQNEADYIWEGGLPHCKPLGLLVFLKALKLTASLTTTILEVPQSVYLLLNHLLVIIIKSQCKCCIFPSFLCTFSNSNTLLLKVQWTINMDNAVILNNCKLKMDPCKQWQLNLIGPQIGHTLGATSGFHCGLN